jgi:hypothetical protein
MRRRRSDAGPLLAGVKAAEKAALTTRHSEAHSNCNFPPELLGIASRAGMRMDKPTSMCVKICSC